MIGPITAKQIRDALLKSVMHTGWTDGMRIPPAKKTVAYSRVDESGSGVEETDDAVGEFTLMSGERFELIVRPLEPDDHIGTSGGATYTHDFSRRDYMAAGLGGLGKMGMDYASVDEDREEMPPPPACPKCGSIQGRGSSWRYLGEDHGVPTWEHKCPLAGPQVGHMSVGMGVRLLSPPPPTPPADPPKIGLRAMDPRFGVLANPMSWSPKLMGWFTEILREAAKRDTLELYDRYMHSKQERGEPYLTLHDWLEARRGNMTKLMSGGYFTETAEFTKEDYEWLRDRMERDESKPTKATGQTMEIGEDID